MTVSKIGTLFFIQSLLNSHHKQLKEYWNDIFLASDNDPSFEEAEEAITNYVEGDFKKRQALHLSLKRSLEKEDFSEDIPERILKIAACKPVDYKLNAAEIEIRLSLLLAMSSISEAKLAVAGNSLKGSISWYGQVSFWMGVHVAAYSAQQRDWDRLDKATAARLKNDPKQAAKQKVKECWDAWQSKPNQYKSKSAFARDMLDKFPHEEGGEVGLESQRVIERWCKEWESELSK